MYLYNVTINIEDSVHDTWLTWMKDVHIPEMLNLGKFSNARILRVCVEEETGGSTYSVQYTTDSRETLQKYYSQDADRMRKEVQKHFANKFVAFRTELELIDEY